MAENFPQIHDGNESTDSGSSENTKEDKENKQSNKQTNQQNQNHTKILGQAYSNCDNSKGKKT